LCLICDLPISNRINIAGVFGQMPGMTSCFLALGMQHCSALPQQQLIRCVYSFSQSAAPGMREATTVVIFYPCKNHPIIKIIDITQWVILRCLTFFDGQAQYDSESRGCAVEQIVRLLDFATSACTLNFRLYD